MLANSPMFNWSGYVSILISSGQQKCIFNGFSVDSKRQMQRNVGHSHAVRTRCNVSMLH